MNAITRRGLRLVATVTVLAVTLPAIAEPDGRGPFVDSDGSVHEQSIAALWAAGITAGCSEWRFCPDDAVTRQEMAAFLTRALELPVSEVDVFTDTDASLFADDIDAIAAAGITAGCGGDRYCPARPVTRAQMASFLARALDLPPAKADAFGDDGGSIHENNINRIAAAGITEGCDTDRYCPYRPVTRAEMATLLARALDLEAPPDLPEIPEEVLDDYLDELAMALPGPERWRRLIEDYFEPGDVDRAMRIMACESLGDPEARNSRSGASGLFQHMPRYWKERSAAAGFAGSSVFDPVANVAVAAWLVYDYPGGGWKHWVCR